MKVVFGGTRMVLIFSNYVIKIPKFNFLLVLKKFCEFAPQGKVIYKLKKLNNNGNIIKSALKYFCLDGFIANRNEYFYSKKHKDDDKVVHVTGLFYYFILIQKRGKMVEETNHDWKTYESKINNEFKKNQVEFDPDLTFKNFCIFGEKLLLIDYGHTGTLFVLENMRYVLP